MLHSFPTILAQVMNFDDNAPRPAENAAPRGMTSRDFFQGMHQAFHNGPTDNSFQKGVLVAVAIVAIIALIAHLRQRWQSREPPHSTLRLARELTRGLKFSFLGKLLLWWVGYSTSSGFIPLLLSGPLFDRSIQQWAQIPTLAPLRRWGYRRLLRLRPLLFEVSAEQ